MVVELQATKPLTPLDIFKETLGQFLWITDIFFSRPTGISSQNMNP